MDRADRIEISCSPDLPPYKSAILIFLPQLEQTARHPKFAELTISSSASSALSAVKNPQSAFRISKFLFRSLKISHFPELVISSMVAVIPMHVFHGFKISNQGLFHKFCCLIEVCMRGP